MARGAAVNRVYSGKPVWRFKSSPRSQQHLTNLCIGRLSIKIILLLEVSGSYEPSSPSSDSGGYDGGGGGSDDF